MREQGWGRIVNVSSMGANFVFPGGGIYHATKYAVDAISDALRFEVKGFGVDVAIIQPGLISTEFGDAATAALARAGDGAVRALQRGGRQGDGQDVYESGPLGKLGGGPETVAKAIEKAITATQPEDALPRHAVGAPAHRPAQADDRRDVGQDAHDPVPAAREVTLRASRAACVASIVGGAGPRGPARRGRATRLARRRALWGSRRCAIRRPFAWAGPWIAVRGGEAVLMFGVPSGVVYDPAGDRGERADRARLGGLAA